MTDIEKGPRDDRWYINIMAPNTKGDKFAWLDPTSIYINADAFNDLLDDLCTDLEGVEYDVVAGLDGSDFYQSAKRENCVSIPITSALAIIRVAHRAWKCACLHLPQVIAYWLLINGSKRAAQWTVQSG
jgi:hypothetical protein